MDALFLNKLSITWANFPLTGEGGHWGGRGPCREPTLPFRIPWPEEVVAGPVVKGDPFPPCTT